MIQRSFNFSSTTSSNHCMTFNERCRIYDNENKKISGFTSSYLYAGRDIGHRIILTNPIFSSYYKHSIVSNTWLAGCDSNIDYFEKNSVRQTLLTRGISSRNLYDRDGWVEKRIEPVISSYRYFGIRRIKLPFGTPSSPNRNLIIGGNLFFFCVQHLTCAVFLEGDTLAHKPIVLCLSIALLLHHFFRSLHAST